ncbi:MAG: C25 family cysteine peptidase [Promethearchaeota archaeon]
MSVSEGDLGYSGYSDVELSFIPEIDYESLNNSWYNPKINMLIISPNETDFFDALKPLRDWKNEKGVKTIILSNYSLYEGGDTQEKIRNMIKTYYEKEDIQWVLLAGDAQSNLIPIRYVYNPDVIRWGEGAHEVIGNEYDKPTDYYYADLTGSWDSDEDGNYGEAPQDNTFGLDEISWNPEVYIGRLPANDASELEIMVNKTIKYEKDPLKGEWMGRMLLAGGISSINPPEDEARLTQYIWENYVLPDTNFTHLSRTTSSFTPNESPAPNDEGTLTRTNLKSRVDAGYSTMIFAGHGTNAQFSDIVSTYYTSGDAAVSVNDFMPSLVYVDACSTSTYDLNDDSIGETLIKRTLGGAIGYIGGLRVTWYFENDDNLEKLNRGNAKLFWREFFQEKSFQQGKALYDSKTSYLKSEYYTQGSGSIENDFERKQLLTYGLLGDPEVDVYTGVPKLASNPFTEDIYEAQLASITITNVDNKTIPYARIHFTSIDGKYHTIYADKDGTAKFRLPAQANETYNVTITGHNLIPSYFNFTTLPDNLTPLLYSVDCLPDNPSTSEPIYFNINIDEPLSGVERVVLLISQNNFENYSYFSLFNEWDENENEVILNIDKMSPGTYSFFLVARDYANNTNVFYAENFSFTIPKPIIEYVFLGSLFAIIGVIGISVLLVFKNLQRYSRITNSSIKS